MAATVRARFAHLTDLHLGTVPCREYPTAIAVVRSAVAECNRLGLDFVVLTGDLLDDTVHLERDLHLLRELLDGLDCPFYLGVGNHDMQGRDIPARRMLWRQVFPDLARERGLYYHHDPVPGLRLIMLDTTETPEVDYLTWRGFVSLEQADWFSRTLETLDGRVPLVGLHHPPRPPLPFLRLMRLMPPDERRLLDCLEGLTVEGFLLAGHYHVSHARRVGRATILTGPSLVEHPHAFRVCELDERGLHVRWHALPGEPLPRRVFTLGTRLRHRVIARLNRAHHGSFPLSGVSS